MQKQQFYPFSTGVQVEQTTIQYRGSVAERTAGVFQYQEIDLSNQPNGIYYLNGTTAAGTQTYKLAVIH